MILNSECLLSVSNKEMFSYLAEPRITWAEPRITLAEPRITLEEPIIALAEPRLKKIYCDHIMQQLQYIQPLL
jgi:hypothetical protein